MRRMALAALLLAAASAGLFTGVRAQTKVVQMPQPQAAEQSCPQPNPQVVAFNDRQTAQLADIDRNLASIAYYLCLIENDMSRDKPEVNAPLPRQ